MLPLGSDTEPGHHMLWSPGTGFGVRCCVCGLPVGLARRRRGGQRELLSVWLTLSGWRNGLLEQVVDRESIVSRRRFTARNRVAYAEIHAEETAATAIGVLRRAVAWFADQGVIVERVLPDNGSAYRSHAWREACAELAVTHKRTRPYRPQTNGKIERFHRTLADGGADARLYDSETERRAALPGWLHLYNYHRAHSAIGGRPPGTRLTNLPGHHI